MIHKYILYRILGNDLPPRHGERQTLENLRFLLDHEPEFPDCEKRWVVNRIADGERERELIDLLEGRGQTYVRIPFGLAEFGERFLDADRLPDEFNLMEIAAGKLPPNGGGHALEWLYRQKNLYAINVNGARNAALDDGIRAGAEWIMPWDGACFLTASGFAAIRNLAAQKADAHYLIVPMARVTDNRALLDPAFSPKAGDEPQIVFRQNAADRFDDSLRYGHRPKAELLARLGVPGPWQSWPSTTWEKSRYPTAIDKGRFVTGGWVGRLDAQASKAIEAGDSSRWLARFKGLAAHCADLEKRLVESAQVAGGLNCYSFDLRGIAATNIVGAADAALAIAPVSVTDKAGFPKGVGRNDYVSIGRYFHPVLDGSFVIRDGITNPAAIRGTREAEAYDRYRLQTVIESVSALALGLKLTGQEAYAAHARAFVERWFINPETRMNPHLRFAQIRPDDPASTNNIGVIDFRDLWALCDALRILRGHGALDDQAESDLQKWFRGFQDQLTKRSSGASLRSNNIAVFYDLVAATVAAYVNDTATLATILTRGSLRIHGQIGTWGWQEKETARTQPLHYSLFAIQGMIALASLSRQAGIDLWKYAGANHRSIPMALRFLAVNRTLFAEYPGAAEHFDDRIELARRAIPHDAADYGVLADLPRQALHNGALLGADEGFAPLWPALLAEAGDRFERVAYGNAA